MFSEGRSLWVSWLEIGRRIDGFGYYAKKLLQNGLAQFGAGERL